MSRGGGWSGSDAERGELGDQIDGKPALGLHDRDVGVVDASVPPRGRVAGAGFLTEIANGHRYQVALELAWPRFHDGTVDADVPVRDFVDLGDEPETPVPPPIAAALDSTDVWAPSVYLRYAITGPDASPTRRPVSLVVAERDGDAELKAYNERLAAMRKRD